MPPMTTYLKLPEANQLQPQNYCCFRRIHVMHGTTLIAIFIFGQFLIQIALAFSSVEPFDEWYDALSLVDDIVVIVSLLVALKTEIRFYLFPYIVSAIIEISSLLFVISISLYAIVDENSFAAHIFARILKNVPDDDAAVTPTVQRLALMVIVIVVAFLAVQFWFLSTVFACYRYLHKIQIEKRDNAATITYTTQQSFLPSTTTIGASSIVDTNSMPHFSVTTTVNNRVGDEMQFSLSDSDEGELR